MPPRSPRSASASRKKVPPVIVDLYELKRPSISAMNHHRQKTERDHPYARFGWRRIAPGRVMICIQLPFVLQIRGVA